MTPEALTCDKCGKQKRIETDDEKFLKEKKEKFIKDHEQCQKPVTK